MASESNRRGGHDAAAACAPGSSGVIPAEGCLQQQQLARLERRLVEAARAEAEALQSREDMRVGAEILMQVGTTTVFGGFAGWFLMGRGLWF